MAAQRSIADIYDSAGQLALLREERKRYQTNSFDRILAAEERLLDEQQLLALKPELARFPDRYAALFGRDENQAPAHRFVQGLLHQGERRHTENSAEALDGGSVRTLQAFVTIGAWHDHEPLAEWRRHVLEVLVAEDAVWNSDETGFPKQGTQSVGVPRQYSGTLGRTDHCQFGVFANYCSSKGHTFRDRRLFLPEDWANEGSRRTAAGVPEDVLCRTKPALALERLAQAVAAGVPFRWAGGASVYGNNPTFVQGERALGKWYVLASACDTPVWTAAPQVLPADQRPRRGRPPTKPRVVGQRRRVAEIVAALPATAWRRVLVGEGSQGPQWYESTERTVWCCADEWPAAAERLWVRLSLGQPAERKYHRNNAPAAIPLQKVAPVRGTRWTIEKDLQCGKGECGLDDYATRGWVGWHHHTALSMLALAFLALQKQRSGEKRGTTHGSRGAGAAGAVAGSARVGQRRNPAVVGLVPRTQPQGSGQPSQAAARRVAAAAK